MAFKDADQIPSATVLRADVCIVGGGPAGISVALALIGSGVSVVLLESGGLREEPDPQELNLGVNTGLDYYELHETRHRVFGGSTARWAGWCRRMDPSDFESRPWIDTTGWPITFDELVPSYREAARLCQLDDTEFSDEPDSSLPPVYQEPFIGNDVEIARWQGSPPTKFGEVYRDELDAAAEVTVYTHASAVEILTDEDGTRTTGVRAATAKGTEFEVAASTVVLCAGAIESARLMLASRTAKSAGLGNDHDLVGRYFMEHPHLVTARLELLPPNVTGRPSIDAIDLGFLGTRARLAMQRPSGSAKVAYVISEERRKRDHILNFSTHIRTVSKVNREDSEAYQAFKLVVNNMRSPSELAKQVRTGAIPEGAAEQMKRMVRGLPEIGQVVYQEALKKPTELALYTQSEQVPNRESRVTIDDSNLDATGLPRVELHWQLSRVDKESIVRSHEILSQQFTSSGLGVLLPEPAFLDDGPDWGPGLRGGHHHMGTTRMADDAHHGVVDRNGRVHSVQGLYVGVFPTGGFANPLLTLVALAWRLGEHLDRELS